MSKLIVAAVGAAAGVGLAYGIWRYRSAKAEAERKAKSETDKDKATGSAETDASAGAVESPEELSSRPADTPAAGQAPGSESAPGRQTAPPATAPPSQAPRPAPRPAPASSPPAPQPTPRPKAPAVTPTAPAATLAASSTTPTMDLMNKLIGAVPRPKPAPAPKPSLLSKKGKYSRLTISTFDKRTGHVHQSPAELLEQARRVLPNLTQTEYTAARLIASEHARGTVTEWAAILDAELNRAPKQLDQFTKHVAPRGTYGYQGTGKRRVATTRDPTLAHVEIAKRVLNGDLRGISKGAVQFFDPRSQVAMHRKWTSGGDRPPALPGRDHLAAVVIRPPVGQQGRVRAEHRQDGRKARVGRPDSGHRSAEADVVPPLARWRKAPRAVRGRADANC